MSTVDCKVVLLGSANTGKTCLLQRFIHGCFTKGTQATVAGSYAAKKHAVGDIEIVLACWDTAGSERYATMSRLYYRKARAAIICFDLTNRITYDRARYWISELLSTEEGCKLYLCGTKKDLIVDNPDQRSVKEDEAKDLANVFRCGAHWLHNQLVNSADPDETAPAGAVSSGSSLFTDLNGAYFETSSKTGLHVEELFKKIAEDFANNETIKSTDNNNICSKSNSDTFSRGIVDMSWHKDKRIVREHSSCCLKN